MKRVAIASTLFVAFASGSAVAADLQVKAPVYKAPPVVAEYNWTGCHIGGNVGGKWAKTSGTINIPGATGPGGTTAASSGLIPDGTSSTIAGGGQLGCDWQSGHWVVGLEGDADWHKWSATTVAVAGALPALFVAGDTFTVTSKWQASARGRVGYAWDRLLIYGTGGIAFTNVTAGANWIAAGIFPATVASDSATLVGGTVGGGFEYAFWNNVSFGVEGRYTWYGTHTYNAGLLATSTAQAAFTFAPTTQSIKLETAEVLARLNWKLN